MPVTPRDAGQFELTIADQVVYTCPGATSMTLRTITVCNTTAGALDVTVYKVPNGQVAGDKYVIMGKDLRIPGPGEVVDDSLRVLEAGGTIVAHASANAGLSISLDGAETT